MSCDVQILNFGTRANNIGHSTLDFLPSKSKFFGAKKFRRAETTSGGSLGPPKKRSACRNQKYSRPQSLCAHDSATKAKALGSKMSFGTPKFCTFRGRKDGLEESEEQWYNSHLEQRCHIHVNRPVVRGYETVQLENSKTSKETREVYSTLQVSNTFYLIQFDHNMMHLLKDCEVTGLLIDARDKFESQIFLVLFFHCILAYIYKLGTFVYK